MPTQPKTGQETGGDRPKTDQDRPNETLTSPDRPYTDARWAKIGANAAPDWPRQAPKQVKTGHDRPREIPRRAKTSLRQARMDPRQAKTNQDRPKTCPDRS